MKQKDSYPCQDGYKGRKTFSVSHPDYGSITVMAGDKAGAIAVAAGVWGARWQKYAFYAYCDVHEVRA